MGFLKIVALDEGCNRPLFCSLNSGAIAPANTRYELSVTTAFNTKAMCAKKVIQP